MATLVGHAQAGKLPDPACWAGRRVLITGHTGFKGAWLALWLQRLGAHVSGLALAPEPGPNLYTLMQLGDDVDNHLTDLRDAAGVAHVLQTTQPEIVLHLAAQPLVRISYHDPVATWATNVQGTVHVLEAVRQTPSVKAVLVITTDKVYDNPERGEPFVEGDRLGGVDPYSSSKAAVELVAASYRDSFLATAGVAVATARAGNVIGGGDWAVERLLPDCLRAWQAGKTLAMRYPTAVRPWQHVLEPLCGYLLLAERLLQDPSTAVGAWNFGPDTADCLPVGAVVSEFAGHWRTLTGQAAAVAVDPSPQPHEAGQLRLDASKARAQLTWAPRWPLATALHVTAQWYDAWQRGAAMRTVTEHQIAKYLADGHGVG